MSKSYCSVDGCLNKSDKLGSFRFFKLPVNKERCKIWLEKIGRNDLLERKEFRPHSYCVCSAHFRDCYLVTKLYLTSDAVPSLHLPGSTECREAVFPAEEIEVKPNDKSQNTFHKLAGWQSKIKDLSKLERRKYALKLYLEDPNAYRLLRPQFKFPKMSTLNRLVRIPLNNDKAMEYLALKMKSLPSQAKHCTMCLGEVKLKPHLFYNTKEDNLIGFQSINNRVTNRLATRAYVIMLQGIFYKWKQPLSYAFVPDVECLEDLGSWVDSTILALHKIGVEVKAVISDQNSDFVRFAKDVKDVTVETPYFFVKELKVYYVFDVPTLLCSVRDGLVATDFMHEGDIISWKYINILFAEESARGLRLVPKMTVAHVNPETNRFRKARVDLATHVFSRTVSNALDAHVTFKSIVKEASATSRFVESMNNLFDVLNSSKLKSDNPLQLPFKDTVEQRYVLTEALKMFSNLGVIPKDKLDVAIIYETFQNFQITIQSVCMLYEEFSDQLFEQIFTRRLNKNNLDVLLESIAPKDAENTIPTPVKFRRAFSKKFMFGMLRLTPRKNADLLRNACIILSEAYIAMATEDATPSLVLLEEKKVTPSLYANPKKKDYQIDLPQDNPLRYIASYVLHQCSKEHPCDFLALLLKKCFPMHYQGLNRRKPFWKHLKLPPKRFVDYIASLESAFVGNCESLTSERPGSTILEAMRTIPLPFVMPCKCFPFDYCFKLFIRLRIYTTLRFNQREIEDGIRVISVQHL